MKKTTKTLSLALALATFGNLNAFAQETSNIDWVKNIMCTMQYDPVCAQKEVQCIKAPCEPVEQTYWNACMAWGDWAKVLYKWECEVNSKKNQLEWNEYKLAYFNDKKVSWNYTMSFENWRMWWKICNSMGWDYSIDWDKLSANMISTLMACYGEAWEIENAFDTQNMTYSISEWGSLFLTTTSWNKFIWEYQPKSADFNFQWDWKLTNYNWKTTEQNIVLNFSWNSLSTKICNSLWWDYKLSKADWMTYNLDASLASTRMACNWELGEIENNFDLSGAKINLPMDTVNHFMLKTSKATYEFERKNTDSNSNSSVINTVKQWSYLDIRVKKLLMHLADYQNRNNLTTDKILEILKSWIEKINQLQIVSIMTPIQNAKMELRKKVYQLAIYNIENIEK